MAREPFSLKRLLEKANIAGDVKYGQWHKEQAQRGQSALGKLADEAAKKASGEYEGKWAMDLLKGGASLLGPWGKLASTGLSLADMLLMSDYRKSQKLGKADVSGLSSPYRRMLSRQGNVLSSQLEENLKGSLKTGGMSNLLNVATNVLTMPGLETSLENAKYNRPFFHGGDVTYRGFTGDSLLDKYGSQAWFETAQKSIHGLTSALGVTNEPWLQSALVHGLPQVQKFMQPDQRATVPVVPGMERGSLRRRIM